MFHLSIVVIYIHMMITSTYQVGHTWSMMLSNRNGQIGSSNHSVSLQLLVRSFVLSKYILLVGGACVCVCVCMYSYTMYLFIENCVSLLIEFIP